MVGNGAGGTKFSIDIGFPIRYAFAAARRRARPLIRSTSTAPTSITCCRSRPTPTPWTLGNEIYTTTYSRIPNGVKPDSTFSGGPLNPIPQLSIVAYAQLRSPTSIRRHNFQVPVTLRIEGSLSHQLDIGLEFTLLNIKPPDPESRIDNCYISAFAQARY